MKILRVSPDLNEKIYDMKYQNDILSKVTTYFPLEENEKHAILKASETTSKIIFKSIFSDTITQKDWIETKEQIKKKFQDELVNID